MSGFEGHLKVAEVGSSRLISITFSDHNPQVAAQVANQVVAEYKSYLLSSNFTSSREVSQWLSAQLGDLSGQVTKTQQAVAEFERRIISPPQCWAWRRWAAALRHLHGRQ